MKNPKLGNKFFFGGHQCEIKKAYTREIEDANNVRYYHDRVTNTVGNVVKVLSVIRSGDFRRDLKAMEETRRRLDDLIKRFDTETGREGASTCDTVEADGRMFVDPGLIELIRKQPDSEALETALYVAWPTPDAKHGLYKQWAATVTKHQGEQNTEELLREKSAVLAAFIIYNLDIAQDILDIAKGFNAEAPKLSDEQKASIRLEEAALWHRVIDELSHRYLGQEVSCPFINQLLNDLLHILVLQGYSPRAVSAALVGRIKEFGQYREWISEEGKGAAGTLFWEAGKHISEPAGCGYYIAFLCLPFVKFFLTRLKMAFVYELLTGRNDRLRPS